MENHRWLFVLIVVGLVCVVAQQISAQQAPAPSPGVIRINVNLVQVDAVVTDSKGKPVTNLKAEDFEVLQDGKVQKIKNFEFVRVKDTLGSMTVRPSAILPTLNPAIPTPPPPPNGNLKPNEIRRTIALVVDDIALSFDGTVHVREALKRWIDSEMQPGDLVSVVRTNAAMGALQQFTNDKRLLYAALDHLKFQPGRVGAGGFAAFTPAPEVITDPSTGAPVPAIDTSTFDMELETAYLMGSYNAIQYVIHGLRDLPGRKSMILFSEDLALPSLDSTGQQRRSIEDRLRLLADEANRSSVVIYAIDPRGSVYTGPTASDNLSGRSATEIASMINTRSEQYLQSQDGMVLLAQRTGGMFYASSNNLAVTVGKAVSDGDGYYLMGYTPDEATFDSKMDTLRYHAIKVRLKRPGLTVRSRTGFYGLSDSPPHTLDSETPQAQLARALVSPFATADLRVRLTTLFGHSEETGAYIETLLYFDAHDLTFTEQPDGSHTAAVDIAVVTFNGDGNPSQAVNKTMTLRVPKAQYEAVLRQGLVHSLLVPIKKPGAYQLRVALRDDTSKKLGSAMQFVDVPDVGSGRLALSGIVVASDPPIAGSPEGTPAVRIFKAGNAISYAYEILNARTGPNDKTQLESIMRLYRDGEIVHEGTPSPLNLSGEKDGKRVAVGGHLGLTRIPPGNYVMQIIVFDGLRKDKNKAAAQTIDFEVQ